MPYPVRVMKYYRYYSLGTRLMEIFNISKPEYKKALKDSGYNLAEFKFIDDTKKGSKCNRAQNLFRFNPSSCRNVSTNVVKRLHKLIGHHCHFPKTNKFSKVLYRNIINVSYVGYGENLSCIIVCLKKKLTNKMLKKYHLEW